MAKILRKAQKRLNARRNAHSQTLKDVKNLGSTAYRQPGSMKRK